MGQRTCFITSEIGYCFFFCYPVIRPIFVFIETIVPVHLNFTSFDNIRVKWLSLYSYAVVCGSSHANWYCMFLSLFIYFLFIYFFFGGGIM